MTSGELKSIGHYDLLGPLGEGGMGVLYRARDRRLDRPVALKLLRPELLENEDRRRRFVQEARAASALNHPNIVTVYDVGDVEGGAASYIAMELVAGEPLSARLARGPLPVAEAVRLGAQVAGALAAAHAAGIVHRDVKPANILVTTDGQVKVCDFGLAKLGVSSVAETLARDGGTLADSGMTPPLTRAGLVLGTPAYMSPEQAEGLNVDARSDVFSLGATLYEMLTGRRPFRGETGAALISSIMRDEPPPLRSLRKDVPREVAALIEKSLAKDPARRYADAAPVRDALLAAERALEARRARPRWVVPAALVLLAVGMAGGWAFHRASRQRWARETLLAQAERSIGTFRPVAAHLALVEARRILGDDPRLVALERDARLPFTIGCEPEGAEILAQDYSDPDGPWLSLGRAPLTGSVPAGPLRLRFRHDGYETLDAAVDWNETEPRYKLFRAGEAPAGMVFVRGGPYQSGQHRVTLDDYWLDRYEVTNREFKAFVDAGGYARPELWKHPFVKDGRALTFAEAMRELRDSTGRPGPSTWELGAPLAGTEDHPVGGVSWYEAAAYAEFAGKSLPTLFHWSRAAGLGLFSDILSFSNFGAKGPTRRGERHGISPWGAYDMAGNVREWVSTPIGERRYVLGGSWNDPTYMFTDQEALSPWDRREAHGFRCARFPRPPAGDVLGPVDRTYRDYANARPASDEIFAIYLRQFAYDRVPLPAATARAADTEAWRRETVEIPTAYGTEKLPVHVYLPRGRTGPFQPILYFPPGSALSLASADQVGPRDFGFLVKSGRAVVMPVYQGTYERRLRLTGPLATRDMVVQRVKDASRAIDYIESRKDLDAKRLGYLGFSLGATMGLRITAVEPRFGAVAFVAGGMPMSRPTTDEIDALHYVPRIRAPLLLVSGRDDFIFPVEKSQKPLMQLLRLPADRRRHVTFEGGHVPARSQDVYREVLDWFDRWLGPVS